MRRSLALLTLSALACLGLPAFAAGPAAAAVYVSAPHCESGASQMFCDVTASNAPTTVYWTVRGVSYWGSSETYFGCQPRVFYSATYTWTSRGVTYISYTGGTTCNSGPWS